jgi:hypothetical protein
MKNSGWSTMGALQPSIVLRPNETNPMPQPLPPTPEPEPESESPRLTRQQFSLMSREERRVLQRLLKSPEGLAAKDLQRSLNCAMPARLFHRTLTRLLYDGYIYVNRDRRLTALPLIESEIESESRLPQPAKLPLPRPVAVTYIISAPTPAPRDIIREIASGPYNPNDPRRRGLFSLSR